MRVLENKLVLPIIKMKKFNLLDTTKSYLKRFLSRPRVYKTIEPGIYESFNHTDRVDHMMKRGNYERTVF